MYRAKAEGKNGYCIFDSYMQDLALARLKLETGLRSALKNGEITLVYQPLINLQTNEIVGAEALARWFHPVNGAISPAEFIPVAEETGEIIAIGYWALEEACIQTKIWLDAGCSPNFQMSVNVSGRQLQRSDVVERVAAILKQTQLPAKNLKLEITESTLMEDREEIIEKMRQLKELGLQLALDDFGTGYSSLSTLRLFPIDTLKIDRAFISRLGDEEGAMAIVEAISAMAKSMKIDVTGEGVETDAQRDFIRNLGCNTGQGYFYDRPLSIEEFSQRLDSAERANNQRAA
jgi:EAL domain-containing protein (putative c-di-GMP-specific phosphodiesterase class I)